MEISCIPEQFFYLFIQEQKQTNRSSGDEILALMNTRANVIFDLSSSGCHPYSTQQSSAQTIQINALLISSNIKLLHCNRFCHPFHPQSTTSSLPNILYSFIFKALFKDLCDFKWFCPTKTGIVLSLDLKQEEAQGEQSVQYKGRERNQSCKILILFNVTCFIVSVVVTLGSS